MAPVRIIPIVEGHGEKASICSAKQMTGWLSGGQKTEGIGWK